MLDIIVLGFTGVHFIASPSTAVFSHRTSAYSETSHDSRRVQRNDKRDILYHDLPKSGSVSFFMWIRILMCACLMVLIKLAHCTWILICACFMVLITFAHGTWILMCVPVWWSLSHWHMALGSLSTFPASSRKKTPVFGTLAPHKNLSLSNTLIKLTAVCHRQCF
jgi:hypothetical protein